MDFSEELSRLECGSEEHRLLEKVLEKLGSNFIRKSTEDKKREAHNNLNTALQRYFESYIYANSVLKSAEQLEISKGDKTSPVSVSPLYSNYVQKYLSSELLEKPILFGLSQESISNAMEIKNSELETAAFKKLVEDNISHFCKQLVQSLGNIVSSDGDWRSSFDITIKELEYKATILSRDESKEQSKKQLREMVKTYYEELSKGVLLLNKLLSLHSEKLQFESNLAKFYLYRCQLVTLKMKVFELKMLESMYNQETIPALKKISAQLDQSEQKLKEDENEKTVALEQYLRLGEEYEHFVEEYTQLTKSIREQQWAIDELKNRST